MQALVLPGSYIRQRQQQWSRRILVKCKSVFISAQVIRVIIGTKIAFFLTNTIKSTDLVVYFYKRTFLIEQYRPYDRILHVNLR